MIRADMISTVGRAYLTSNIENDEYSYPKAYTAASLTFAPIQNSAGRKFEKLDIRFVKDNVSDGEVTLRFDVSNVSDPSFFEMVTAWAEQAAKYRSGEISKEDYDKWRYRFPEFDTTQIWAKVPSKELSDALVDAFKDKLKD